MKSKSENEVLFEEARALREHLRLFIHKQATNSTGKHYSSDDPEADTCKNSSKHHSSCN